MRSLEKKFLKTYSQINIPKLSPRFQERMDFDIYKRVSKLERLEQVRSSSKKRIDSNEKEALFDRLYDDTERRKRIK